MMTLEQFSLVATVDQALLTRWKPPTRSPTIAADLCSHGGFIGRRKTTQPAKAGKISSAHVASLFCGLVSLYFPRQKKTRPWLNLAGNFTNTHDRHTTGTRSLDR